MSDSGSVCSSHSAMSISLLKLECPYCQKELQTRVMFNHIRKFHYTEFLKQTTRRFLEEALTNKPLKLFWTKLNDFDEEEEIVLFACLSTNKTFTSEMKAMAHFAKDKKALKDHSKQMKDVKKDYLKMKSDEAKQTKRSESQQKFFNAKRANDPALARAFWRAILHSCRILEICQHICEKRGYKAETPMYVLNPGGNRMRRSDFQEISYSEFLSRHQALCLMVETAKEQHSLNVVELEKLWMSLWNFWDIQYRENIIEFIETLKESMPDYWPETTDEFFGLANETMVGVPF